MVGERSLHAATDCLLPNFSFACALQIVMHTIEKYLVQHKSLMY